MKYSFKLSASSEFIDESLRKKFGRPRTLFNGVMTLLSALCLLATLVPLVAVITYVLLQGFQRFDWALFTQLPPPPGISGGGISNAIMGTVVVVTIATLISLPFGVMTAVYLSEFSAKNALSQGISFATNVLSGVPSIIAGVFVYGLLVRTGLTGFSAVAGGVALAILMLPTIVRTANEAIEIVPQDVRAAAYAMGASRYQTVLGVVLPAAVPAIVTGVMLAVARAAGETAPLIFTALYSNFRFNGLLEPIATLAVLVYNFAIVPFEPQQELAWTASLILVLLVLLTSVVARLVIRRKSY